LLGEQDTAMNEQAAFNRARRLIPHLEAEMFPKTGHILSMEQPEIVDARILKFLEQG
jgi:pimeloyl-ACP methyl ester carboxylesterase